MIRNVYPCAMIPTQLARSVQNRVCKIAGAAEIVR